MNDPPEEDFWGMTRGIWDKRDAQERLKKQKTGAGKGVPSQATGAEVSSPASRHLKTLREINAHHRLAVLYHTQHKPAGAERGYQEVLAALEETVGPKNPEVARVLNNLARLYYEQERYAEAEPLYKRSLAIVEERFGKEDPKVARRLANLAELNFASGKHAEADALYQRALAIEEKELGPKHTSTVKTLTAYTAMLRKMNKPAQAEKIEARFKIRRVIHERRTGRSRRARERRIELRKRRESERRQQDTRCAAVSRRLSDSLMTSR